MQSEKSKKAGNAPPTTLLIDFLKSLPGGCPELVLLEEDMNFNQRAASLTVSTLISSLKLSTFSFGAKELKSNLFYDCCSVVRYFRT